MATSFLVQQYARELRPFTEAGWEIDFNDQEFDQVFTMAGWHRQLETQFTVVLQRYYKDAPDYMVQQIRHAWEYVQREQEKNWPFPPMRIYHHPTTTFEPKDWYQFLSVMQFRSFDREQIKNETFRRHNHIVLATPFIDRAGRQVYELDWLDAGADGAGLMLWDEVENDWRILMWNGGYRILGSAATRLLRLQNREERAVALNQL